MAISLPDFFSHCLSSTPLKKSTISSLPQNAFTFTFKNPSDNYNNTNKLHSSSSTRPPYPPPSLDFKETHYMKLLNRSCKAGKYSEKALDRMRRRGCPPDIVTYKILIGSLCSKGKLGLALEVLDQSLADKCQPTVVTYTILIEAMILEGGIGEATKLLDEMAAKGLRPDNYT